MLDSKFNEPTDLMLIDTALDGRDDGDVEADLREPIQGPEFLFKDVVLLCVCLVLFLTSLPRSAIGLRSS